MEIVDSAVVVIWPGAMDAGLGDALFWISLGASLLVAFAPTFVVNRALIHAAAGTLRPTAPTSGYAARCGRMRSSICWPVARPSIRPRTLRSLMRTRAGIWSTASVRTSAGF
jgi:hypothetical protein